MEVSVAVRLLVSLTATLLWSTLMDSIAKPFTQLLEGGVNPLLKLIASTFVMHPRSFVVNVALPNSYLLELLTVVICALLVMSASAPSRLPPSPPSTHTHSHVFNTNACSS